MADSGGGVIASGFILRVENIDKVVLKNYILDMISFSVKKVSGTGTQKKYHDYPFIMIQTADLAEKGVCVHPYGAVYARDTKKIVLNVETRGSQMIKYQSEEIDVSTCRAGNEYELTVSL